MMTLDGVKVDQSIIEEHNAWIRFMEEIHSMEIEMFCAGVDTEVAIPLVVNEGDLCIVFPNTYDVNRPYVINCNCNVITEVIYWSESEMEDFSLYSHEAGSKVLAWWNKLDHDEIKKQLAIAIEREA